MRSAVAALRGLHKTKGTANPTQMSVQVLLCPQQRHSCVHVWILHLGSLGRAQQCGEADGDNVPDAAVCGPDLSGALIPRSCHFCWRWLAGVDSLRHAVACTGSCSVLAEMVRLMGSGMPHISQLCLLPAECVHADHQGLLPAAHLTSNAAGPVHHLPAAVCKLLQVSVLLCAPPQLFLRSCKVVFPAGNRI